MAEKKVVYRLHSFDELADLVKAFEFLEGDDSIQSAEHILGGLSGTNYCITSSRGNRAVLKVFNGYNSEHVAGLVKVMDHIWSSGFRGMCRTIPLKNQGGFHCFDSENTPLVMLSYIRGRAADVVIRSGTLNPLLVLQGVAAGLGAMSNVLITECDGLKDWRTGGACAVGSHFSGTERAVLTEHPNTRHHSFVPFYLQRLKQLVKCMSRTDLPLGVLHGDPFFDNVLVEESTGEFLGCLELSQHNLTYTRALGTVSMQS